MVTETMLRPLELGDLQAATSLSQEAGWNQVPEDWKIFLDLGEGYGLFDSAEGLVATICLLPYPPQIAWLSMLVVRDSWRRRGLGTRLFKHSLQLLEERGIIPLLDATPLGRPLYLPLGFRDLWGFQRYMAAQPLAATEEVAPEVTVRPLEPRDLDEVIALDAVAFGARREALLRHLLGRYPDVALVAVGPGGLRGSLLGRNGRMANHLGPLTAADPATAMALLHAALERASGPLQVDVPDAQTPLRDYLLRRGFEPRRSFTRMIRGDAAPPGDARLLYAVAGGELG